MSRNLQFTNIADFLKYTSQLPAEQTSALYGFELGNELDGGDYTSTTSVEPEVLATDYLTLRKLIDTDWSEQAKPLLAGPAQHCQVTFARRFLAAVDGV